MNEKDKMATVKCIQNIYGYTGKRRDSYKCLTITDKSVVKEKKTTKGKSRESVNVKKESISDYKISIRVLMFQWEETEYELEYRRLNDSERISLQSGDTLMNEEFTNLQFWLKKGEGEWREFRLNSHEKGLSVTMDSWGVFADVHVEGDVEMIRFLKECPKGVSLTESKLMFEKRDYPFSFHFEENETSDAIFNDFVSSHLLKIIPPQSYVVPVKCTQQHISYRQYIGGYLKTRTLFQFVIEKSGWKMVERIEEKDSEFVKGVDIVIRNEWTFFPRGSRIEHVLYFI